MGSTESYDEQPIHIVHVPSFKIMRTEVTVAQYRACFNAGMCSTPATEYYYFNWRVSGKEDHPQNGISWFQLNDLHNGLEQDCPQNQNGNMQLVEKGVM